MFVVRFQPERSILQYANAGHESGLLLRANDELVELTSTGMILGVDEGQDWTTETVRIDPGDRPLLITDGVTEATGPDGHMFGRKRLANRFESHRNGDVEETLRGIWDAITEFCENRPASDDITLLALEVTDTSATRQ